MIMPALSKLMTFACVFGLVASLPSAVSAEAAVTSVSLSSTDLPVSPPLVLSEGLQRVNLAKGLFINPNESTDKSIAEVVSGLTGSGFRPLQDQAVNEGFGATAVYAYVVIENQSTEDRWFLQLNYALLDHIEVYTVSELGPEKKPLTYIGHDGDTFPFLNRRIKVPGFVFPISLKPKHTSLILIKIQTHGARYSGVHLATAEGLTAAESSSSLGLGLYFGGLLILCIYSLVLFCFLRSLPYLIFLGLVSMMTLFFVAEAGLVSQYVSPRDPIWANLFFLLGLSGISFMGFWLNLVFLRKSLSNREQRLLRILMVCAGLNFVLCFGVGYVVVSRIGLGLIILYMLTSCWLSVRAWLLGYSPAQKYSYAILTMIAGGSLESLRVLGAIPINELSRMGPAAGVAGFIFLMSIALIERMFAEQERAKVLFRSFEKFAPASLVRALHQNGEVVGIGGSRKHVTILFSDIKGYSSVVETTDAQVVVELMTEYFDNMQRSIEAHGGYILEFAGDGILAVFGTPSPLENHPDAASKSAIEMQRIVRHLNQKYEQSGQQKVFTDVGLDGLSIRIGIHTGSVIAGTLGSRQTLKYGVIGDAVNVAARLEALNKELSSTLLISEATFNDVSSQVQGYFEGLGPYAIKGRQEPVNIYRFVQEHHETGDSEASLELRSVNSFDWWEQSTS